MPALSAGQLHGFCQPGPTPGEHQSPGSFCDPIEPTTNVTYQRMTEHEHGGGADGLQPAHRPEALFQKPMVTFDAIGAVAASSMQHTRYRRRKRRWVRPGLVGDDAPWGRLAGRNGLFKERARSNHIACRGDVGINDLSVSVDGAVDVMPAATN